MVWNRSASQETISSLFDDFRWTRVSVAEYIAQSGAIMYRPLRVPVSAHAATDRIVPSDQLWRCGYSGHSAAPNVRLPLRLMYNSVQRLPPNGNANARRTVQLFAFGSNPSLTPSTRPVSDGRPAESTDSLYSFKPLRGVKRRRLCARSKKFALC